jgi:hypothetical protein
MTLSRQAISLPRRRAWSALALALLPPAFWGCGKRPELAPGQIWSYDNRSGEGASTLQVLHIERDTPIGDVIFISVRALDVKRLGRRIRTTEVWPLVFTRSALTDSIRSLQWTEKVERSYLKQLDAWWRDAREGRAADRTFNIPVKEALMEIENDRPGADKRSFQEA